MKALRHRPRYLALSLALLLLGLWLALTALWQLGKTAIFVHEAVIVPGLVVDVRQKPFENWGETLGHGNISFPGDVSYQPWVRFILPGGISAFRADLPADNKDYTIGQQVSIISLPDNPASALLDEWKFLWGADCMKLAAGSLLSLLGYYLLRRLRGKRAADAPAPRAASKEKPAPKAAGTLRRKSAPAAAEANAATPKPRRRKKAESSADGTEAAAPKPRKPRSRKKKQQAAPELPF